MDLTDTERPAADSFANHILGDWDSAMHQFFERVDRKRAARELTVEQVREALILGYGHDIAGAWDEWMEEES